MSMGQDPEFVGLEPARIETSGGVQRQKSVAADDAKTKRDRCVCIAWIVTCAVLLIVSVILFAVFTGRITDWLDGHDSHDDIGTVCLWFLAGLGIWIAIFIPMSLWIIPVCYYLNAWPGVGIVALNILAGQTLMFLFGRFLQNNTRVGERLQAVSPEKTAVITAVRRVFKTKGYQLCFLSMFGPTSTPMLVWVVGLLTEAEFIPFTISAYAANVIVFSPMCVLGLLADNLSDAFSSGDVVSIVVIVSGIVLFVGGMYYAGHVANKEVKRMAALQMEPKKDTRSEDILIETNNPPDGKTDRA